MLSATFQLVYVLLAAIILVRILLNSSNLATFVTLSLTCLLSFTIFENILAFSPLVFFFLKDYVLAFFTWLKTFFFNLKNSFFSSKKEEENESVLAMKGKKEAEESTSPVATEGQSDNTKRPSFFAKKEEGQVTFGFPEPDSETLQFILYNIPGIKVIGAVGFFRAFLQFFICPMAELYKRHRGTLQGQQFVDRRAHRFGSCYCSCCLPFYR